MATPTPATGSDSVTLRQRVSAVAADRIITVPNAISVARLAGVPLFLWLMLGPKADLAAALVLMASGITDWLDGKTARWLGQYSRLGELLDPVADRLYILATLAAFLIRDIVPWWIVALLIGRDLLLAMCLPVLRRRGYGPFEVLYVGKAATFNLLYAFPLLLLAEGDAGISAGLLGPVQAFGYAFAIWGAGLYLWSGVVYVVQFGRALSHPVLAPTEAADRLSG